MPPLTDVSPYIDVANTSETESVDRQSDVVTGGDIHEITSRCIQELKDEKRAEWQNIMRKWGVPWTQELQVLVSERLVNMSIYPGDMYDKEEAATVIERVFPGDFDHELGMKLVLQRMVMVGKYCAVAFLFPLAQHLY